MSKKIKSLLLPILVVGIAVSSLKLVYDYNILLKHNLHLEQELDLYKYRVLDIQDTVRMYEKEINELYDKLEMVDK